MQKPDIPDNEDDRLRTLHALNIVDSVPDERFDRATRIAQRLFRVPMAMVTLVDAEHQHFKSCIGMNSAGASREVSFCGHAILGDETFIVPETLEDERFRDNPLVDGDPKIRFYAGQPLWAPNGHKLGTLCILDHEPRSPAAEDIAALRDLAAMVEQEIQARYIATLDELTDLPNRRGFMDLARKSLDLCVRAGVPASLVFMDLDEFKSINDECGHAQGDRVLRAFGGRMKAVFRNSDALGRLGGDEFVVLVTNTGAAQARSIVDERFRPLLQQHLRDQGFSHQVAFSCGIVEFDPAGNPSLEDLMARGDAVMYESKSSKS